MKKTVLVTGATGLLGVPLCRHLRERGYHVVAHGRSKAADIIFDLSVASQTAEALASIRPNSIVNLVALTNVDTCEEDRQAAYLLNVKSVENLVDAMAKSGNKTCHLVHVSTDQLYDGPGDKSEENVTLSNVYSFSKYCSEWVARAGGATVLRTNFFGKSEVPGRTSLSDFVISNLRARKPIKLVSDVYFSPLSIGTLVRRIERVLEKPTPGTFNLGSHGGLSKADFGLALAKAFGLSTESAQLAKASEMPFKAFRPSDMRMNVGLFEKAFGEPLPTLLEEITFVRSQYES